MLIPSTLSRADASERWAFSLRLNLSRETDPDVLDFLLTEIDHAGLFAIPALSAVIGDDEGEHGDQDDSIDLPDLAEITSHPLYATLADHLTELCAISDTHELESVVSSLLETYVAVPLPSSSSSADIRPTGLPSECELCEREGIPLTIHHLFPRSEHTHLLKRRPDDFTRHALIVTHRAYICRPCHSAVHRIFSNRELADEWFTMERLRESEAVQKWVGYAGKQRVCGFEGRVRGLKMRR